MTEGLSLRDEAMRAFISGLSAVPPSAPAWCSGWSAHELPLVLWARHLIDA